MNVKIAESWKEQLQPEFEKEYFCRLTDFVRNEYANHTVYPPGKLIFNAFDLCRWQGGSSFSGRKSRRRTE